MKDDALTLRLIAQACDKILAFTANISEQEFLNNEEKQSAVIMQLIVLGELAKVVTAETQSMIELPWRRIAGMRDVAVHQYFGLKMEEIWQVVVNDIRGLREKILRHLSGGGS